MVFGVNTILMASISTGLNLFSTSSAFSASLNDLPPPFMLHESPASFNFQLEFKSPTKTVPLLD